eukprot:GHVQ01014307.1.p1 GENE.GHVQ01014307.1~~GHVQ01014307.1.p1  ORF type:complete len:1097 (-),score=162.02 GHVQ01014307.1:1605-4895(-)
MSLLYSCISEEPDALYHLNFKNSRRFMLLVEKELTNFVLVNSDSCLSTSDRCSLPWRVTPALSFSTTNFLSHLPPPSPFSNSPLVVSTRDSSVPPFPHPTIHECASVSSQNSLCFPPLPSRYRLLLHLTAERFGLKSESHGWDSQGRQTLVHLTPETRVPVLKWEDFLCCDCIGEHSVENPDFVPLHLNIYSSVQHSFRKQYITPLTAVHDSAVSSEHVVEDSAVSSEHVVEDSAVSSEHVVEDVTAGVSNLHIDTNITKLNQNSTSCHDRVEPFVSGNSKRRKGRGLTDRSKLYAWTESPSNSRLLATEIPTAIASVTELTSSCAGSPQVDLRIPTPVEPVQEETEKSSSHVLSKSFLPEYCAIVKQLLEPKQQAPSGFCSNACLSVLSTQDVTKVCEPCFDFASFVSGGGSAKGDYDVSLSGRKRSSRFKQVHLGGTHGDLSEHGSQRNENTERHCLRPEWRLRESTGTLLRFRVTPGKSDSIAGRPAESFRVYLYSNRQAVLQYLPDSESSSSGMIDSSDHSRVDNKDSECSGRCCSGVLVIEFTPRGVAVEDPTSTSDNCWWDISIGGCPLLHSCVPLLPDTGRVRRGRGAFRAGTDLVNGQHDMAPVVSTYSHPSTGGSSKVGTRGGGKTDLKWQLRLKVFDPFLFNTNFWIASYAGSCAEPTAGQGTSTRLLSSETDLQEESLSSKTEARHIVLGMGTFPQWIVMHVKMPNHGSWVLHDTAWDPPTPVLQPSCSTSDDCLNVTSPHVFSHYGFGLSAQAVSCMMENSCREVSIRDVEVVDDELLGEFPFSQREHIIELQCLETPAGNGESEIWTFEDTVSWVKAELNSGHNIRAVCGRSRENTLDRGSNCPTPVLVVCRNSISALRVIIKLLQVLQQTPPRRCSQESRDAGKLILDQLRGSLDSTEPIQVDCDSASCTVEEKKLEELEESLLYTGSYSNGLIRITSLACCTVFKDYYHFMDHSSTAFNSADKLSSAVPSSQTIVFPSDTSTRVSSSAPRHSWLMCLRNVLKSLEESSIMEFNIQHLNATLHKRFNVTASSTVHAVASSAAERRCRITAVRSLSLSSGAQRMLLANLPTEDRKRLQNQQGN